jgi:hypothetical protein
MNRGVAEWVVNHSSKRDFLLADVCYLVWSVMMILWFDQSVSTLLANVAGLDGSFTQLTILALWVITGVALICYHIVYAASAIAFPRRTAPGE